jgi:hypothetical protein
MIGIRAPELNQFESKRKRQPGPGGPKGQESLAQVYPGDAFFKVALKGHSGRGRGSVVSGRPFRASRDKPKTQGKPWAKVSWPFGPKTR